MVNNNPCMLTFLRTISDEIEFYMEVFGIPESKQDDMDLDEYLLDTNGDIKPPQFVKNRPANTAEDRKAREEVMKNKIINQHLSHKSKKLTKEARKSLKNGKMLTKTLKDSMIKAIKVEHQSKMLDHKPLKEEKKEKLAPVFNPEGKIVFSKFQLDDSEKVKKGIETDKKKLLKKVLDNNKNLVELKTSGDLEKYVEEKKKQAWDKAMAKTSGQKVRDDPKLLAKKIQKRKKEIKKTKDEWKKRTEQIEQKKARKQKERTANLKERAEKKKNKKLKNLTKKGRVIPGF